MGGKCTVIIMVREKTERGGEQDAGDQEEEEQFVSAICQESMILSEKVLSLTKAAASSSRAPLFLFLFLCCESCLTTVSSATPDSCSGSLFFLTHSLLPHHVRDL